MGKSTQTQRLSARLTCNCLHHHVRHFWDFFINRDTEHLRRDPVQGSIERNSKEQKGHSVVLIMVPFIKGTQGTDD
jgi:hypothetical protein